MYTHAEYEALDDEAALMVVFKNKLDCFLVDGDPHLLKQVTMRVTLNADSADIGKEERLLVVDSKEVHLKKLPEKELRLEMAVSSISQEPLGIFYVEFFGYGAKTNKTSLVKFEIEPDGSQPSSDINIILKHDQFSKH